MFQKIKNEIKIHKKNLKNGRQAKKSKNRVSIWRQSEGAVSIRQKLGN